MITGARLAETGFDTISVDNTECCCVEKVKIWTNGLDGISWDSYLKRAKSESFANTTEANCKSPE